jgi:hypothetical protein
MALIDHAVRTWKIVEKITIPLSIGVMIWALTTIVSLTSRVACIEQNVRENEAQWSLLKQHSDLLREQQIQVEVYKRMFEMLLDKNQLKTDKISLPSSPSGDMKTVEEFKTEQIQRMKRFQSNKE